MATMGNSCFQFAETLKKPNLTDEVLIDKPIYT